MSDEDEVQEITYVPLGGQQFGAEEMFAQGAAALDLAAIFALERKDTEGLINVAKEWTRMAKAVSGVEALPEEKRLTMKFGFSQEIAEEEKDGEKPSKSNGENKLQGRGI
jgi:hypothetical protein